MEYSPHLANRMFLTLQGVFLEAMKVKGCNKFCTEPDLWCALWSIILARIFFHALPFCFVRSLVRTMESTRFFVQRRHGLGYDDGQLINNKVSCTEPDQPNYLLDDLFKPFKPTGVFSSLLVVPVFANPHAHAHSEFYISLRP